MADPFQMIVEDLGQKFALDIGRLEASRIFLMSPMAGDACKSGPAVV